MPFAEAIQRVRKARVLVGVHGAGLTNAVFMAGKADATLVEVLPAAFASDGRFGLIKFGFLPSFDVRHVRVTATEADPQCVREQRAWPSGCAIVTSSSIGRRWSAR